MTTKSKAVKHNSELSKDENPTMLITQLKTPHENSINKIIKVIGI
jgi:hypothetical protein